MSDTRQLHQLQQIDNNIAATKQRLTEIQAGLVETDALKSARAACAEAEKRFHQCRASLTDLELEVKGLQQKISRDEKRLYSGQVKSPKEASSLQDEVASTKRWLAKREEDLLEVMIEFEEQTATQQTCQETLARIQAEWEANQADLLQEQTERQEMLQELLKRRATLVQFIDTADLAAYERLAGKYGGVGLAVVDDGLCMTCGVMVSSRLVQQAQSSDQLYYCESCGRIMHVV